MRKSSRGNPYHWPAGSPKGGQFAPSNSQGLCNESYYPDEYYEKKTAYRNGDMSKEEFTEYADGQKEYQKKMVEQLFNKKIDDTPRNHRVKTDFKPAKTVREAEDYARGMGVTPFYKGMNVDVCNAINQSVAETFKEFPQARNEIHVVGSAQAINRKYKAELQDALYDYLREKNPGTPDYFLEQGAKRSASRCIGRIPSNRFAHHRCGEVNCPDPGVKDCVERYSGIYVNDRYTSNVKLFSEAIENDVKCGFHPEGCYTMKSVIDHECGHAIDYAYGLSGSNSEINSEAISHKHEEVKNGLSEYGASNIREFIAEAWSEYKNNPHPREIATKVGGAMSALGEKDE